MMLYRVRYRDPFNTPLQSRWFPTATAAATFHAERLKSGDIVTTRRFNINAYTRKEICDFINTHTAHKETTR